MGYALDFSRVLTADGGAWIWRGLLLSLALTLLAGSIAFGIGTLLAVVRVAGNRWVEWAIAAYVEFQRNVPMLVHILFWYFGVAALLPDAIADWVNDHNSEFLFAAIAIGLCMAAYISEDLRSGLRAIPKGQYEASQSLGFGYAETMRVIVLPQAMRVSLPALVNQTLLLFKNTSLAMAIGVAELTYRTREIESATFRTFEAFAIATALYLILSFTIMAVGSLLGRRLDIARR
ncbi:amino acid ABC transporter permease [Methylobacterium nodulans]|uniref:Polar amino acid ABC transporter, inner membrane subunit n=1 Tax=Methylobacterium nodulans (strain LMG 21967 / CNCM I-2342 / ORS 2060) TaxID=460265 RepID=B8IGL4_METNO|nr:amino acid ABC transporter permease [Methylobacterium nodulans]ACL55914.1 polar amino acid ABC transporter, inner membrane subunit [Methylobacterium nodulans ORS 2060]